MCKISNHFQTRECTVALPWIEMPWHSCIVAGLPWSHVMLCNIWTWLFKLRIIPSQRHHSARNVMKYFCKLKTKFHIWIHSVYFAIPPLLNNMESNIPHKSIMCFIYIEYILPDTNNPTVFRTWADSTFRIGSQHSDKVSDLLARG